jgi:subfamily B ATP-binding cassette protein MsbA
VTLVFLAVFYRLAPRLLLMQENMYQARVYLSWYENWRECVQKARERPARRFGRRSPAYRDRLVFEGVGFSYPDAPNPVLADLDWSIAQGECCAIVGPSGSGKSTFLDLLSGLLVPTRGRILVDGVPLVEFDMDAWRRSLGLVLQESPIFHATIRENIAWGEESPDPSRIEEAAALAQVREFVEQMPAGLDTVVGERGAVLSGGQRQRLALARALYRRPVLLILDEATSSLDGRSELEVQKALERIQGTCSLVMVAHRLKTVEMADQILVLEQGRIVERGTWQTLMATPGGAFREMARLQELR